MQITEIFLKKLDSYVNPKVENRVIYGALISGMSLIMAPKLIALLSSVSIKSEKYEINLQNNPLDELGIIIGAILIFLAVSLLYFFKFTKRPELIITSDSPSAKLWKRHGYSFQKETLINPLLLKDLVGWLSDSGRQIVSIDIAGANSSNRYFGEIAERVSEERKFIEVSSEDNRELFGYEYLGTSESGIHVVHAYDSTGGSATFHWLLLLQIEESGILEYEDKTPKKKTTPVLKLVGRISLGDRYNGSVIMERGVIRISKDESHLPDHVIKKNRKIIVK
ncbi:hypothetical protein ACJJI4_02195 [Microbulbifer sp. TRSA002]|uniref:hypothetical protein n=1 Tax=unclassified Microbulbifer TaxID=2619833 RepID=UPI0040399E7D